MSFSTCDGTVTIIDGKRAKTYTLSGLRELYDSKPLWAFACALNALFMASGDPERVTVPNRDD